MLITITKDPQNGTKKKYIDYVTCEISQTNNVPIPYEEPLPVATSDTTQSQEAKVPLPVPAAVAKLPPLPT